MRVDRTRAYGAIHVYADPSPETVLRIVENYGWDAACERWHWISQRALSTLVNVARRAVKQAA